MLSDLRKAAGLTQQSLADRAGLSISCIQKWERLGVSRAQAGMLYRAASALGCTVEDLLRDESAAGDGGGAR